MRRVGEVDVSVKEVDEGALYAVLFKDDNSWYRARVINKRSNDTASEVWAFCIFLNGLIYNKVIPYIFLTLFFKLSHSFFYRKNKRV